jgi:hypothetical protein
VPRFLALAGLSLITGLPSYLIRCGVSRRPPRPFFSGDAKNGPQVLDANTKHRIISTLVRIRIACPVSLSAAQTNETVWVQMEWLR